MTDKKLIKVLEITSRPDRFYRAGRCWTKEKQVIPVAEFTKKEIEALKSEPQLVVHEAEVSAGATEVTTETGE